jgi:hypothetical protein
MGTVEQMESSLRTFLGKSAITFAYLNDALQGCIFVIGPEISRTTLAGDSVVVASMSGARKSSFLIMPAAMPLG